MNFRSSRLYYVCMKMEKSTVLTLLILSCLMLRDNVFDQAYSFFMYFFPQRAHDVRMTSYQRRCDVMTSHRRRSYVIPMSCACWVSRLFMVLFCDDK